MGEPLTTEDGENKHLDSAHNLVSDSDMCQLVGGVADVVATAFQVPRDNDTAAGAQQGGRGGDGDDVRVNIGPPAEPAAMSPVLLPRALWTLALLTLIVDVGMMLYRQSSATTGSPITSPSPVFSLPGSRRPGPPSGFHVHLTSTDHRRRFSPGRVVLCASIGPFVIVVAIGSLAFIDD